MTSLIDSARSTLMIEQEEMDDADIEDRLIAAARRGVAVRYELRVDIHQALLSLVCSLICWQTLCRTERKLAHLPGSL